MALFTSSQNGDWGLASTWGDAGVPGNGDRVIINHIVTVSDYRIIGTSQAATTTPAEWDIEVNNGKILIPSGGRLALRGYAFQRTSGTNTVTIEQQGGIFEFDSTQAPTPSTDGYDFYPGDSIWAHGRWVAGPGSIIRSVAGAANGMLYRAGDYQGWSVDFQGSAENPVIVERLGRGDASDTSIFTNNGNGWTPHATSHILKDVQFKSCRKIHGGTSYVNDDFVMERVTFIDSTGTVNLTFGASGAIGDVPDIVHIMNDCSFDKVVEFYGVTNLTVTNCSFMQDFTRTADMLGGWSGNFRYVMGGGGQQPSLNTSNDYLVGERTNGNIKMIYLNSGTHTDLTFEPLNESDSEGECLAGMSPSDSDVTVSGMLCIPMHDGTGLAAGEWLDNGSAKVTLHHCTVPVAYYPPAINSFGFGHGGDDGIEINRAKIRDTIFYNFMETGGIGYKIGWISNDNADPVDPLEIHHNCGFRMAASRYPSAVGSGYNFKQSNTALAAGVGDVDVDPWPHWSATMATRRTSMPRLKTWGQNVLGLSGTNAAIEDAAMQAIHLRNCPGVTGHISTSATPANLRTWVRERWAPSNELLATASSTGDWIGAIAGQSADFFSGSATLSKSISISTSATSLGPVSRLRTTLNNIEDVLTTPYVAGSGKLTVPNGAIYGSPSPANWLGVSCFDSADNPICILQVVGRSGNDLTVLKAIEGTTDTSLPIGSKVMVTITAGTITEIHNAIADAENPAGAENTQILFKNNNAVAGDSALTYDTTTDTLVSNGNIKVEREQNTTTPHLLLKNNVLQGEEGAIFRVESQFAAPIGIYSSYDSIYIAAGDGADRTKLALKPLNFGWVHNNGFTRNYTIYDPATYNITQELVSGGGRSIITAGYLGLDLVVNNNWSDGVRIGNVDGIFATFTNGTTTFTTTATDKKTFVIKAVASQTANLLEVQNSSGSALAYVTAAGVFIGNGSGLTDLNASYLTTGVVPAARLDGALWPSGRVGFNSTYMDIANGGATLRMGAFDVLGTGDSFFQAWPANNAGYGYLENWGGQGMVVGTGSGGPVLIRPNRQTVAEFLSGSNTHALLLTPITADSKGLVVQATATHTDNLAEFQNSSGTVLSYVSATGDLMVGGLIGFGDVPTSGTRVFVRPSVNTDRGITIRALTDQTGYLLEFQTAGGGSFGGINGAGVFIGNGSGLTDLSASNLSTGTVATARLGSGTADATTFLRGDGSWATPPGGSATAAGTAGQIQYNDGANVLDASANLSYDEATGIFTHAGNRTNLGGAAAAASFHYSTVGVMVKPGTGDRALLELHSPSGGTRCIIQAVDSWGVFIQSQTTAPTVFETISPDSYIVVCASLYGGLRFGASGISNDVGIGRPSANTLRITQGDSGYGILQTGDLTAFSRADASVPFKVVAASASQTGNLTEWAAQDGTPLSYVTAAGVFTGNGSGLTNLNASNLASGTVPTARLGTGTADATTYLRGDGTWATVSAGSSTLSALTDVSISSPADKQYLRHNGTNWVNSAIAMGDLGTGTPSSTTYLRGDGVWATPPGSTDGDKGDITISGGGATWTIDNGAVSYAKIQNASTTQRVIGRNTAGAGVLEEVTASQFLDWLGSTQGQVLYRGASGWTVLPPGTSGWLLQSGGAAGDPSWTAPPTGTTPWTTVKKTADQTKTATTTLANDTALSFSMAANTKYSIRARVYYETTSGADLKWRHVGPASPTLVRLARTAIVPGATTVSGVAIDTAFSAADITITGNASDGGYFDIDGIVHNGANAGTFAIQWAQNTSDAGNTIVRAGSYIEYMTS